MASIVLFGNGQIASVTYYRLMHDSPHDVVAFTVDGEYIREKTLFDLPVVAFEEVESLYSPDEYKMFVSIGYRQVNKLRAEKYAQAKVKGYELISYISSKAITWPGLKIGANCLIAESSTIHPFVEIGNNVFIGTGSLVGHHSVIKDHCTLAARVTLTGSTTVEPYCFLGANSTIRDRVMLARECVIGAGAVILEDTREREVYLGKSADLLPISSDALPLA